MKKINFIHVGLGNYSIQRLEILKKNKNFNLVGLVDTDKNKIFNLSKENRKIFFSSISKANAKVKADAAFIYVSANKHAKLVCESLVNNLHTLCVKPISLNFQDFKKIIKIKSKKRNLLLIQGQNNQWNDASLQMKKIINNKNFYGNFKLGYCVTWGRQILTNKNARKDSESDGSFFHSMACHQLGQLVAILGLPLSVYSKSSIGGDRYIGYKNIPRTASGSVIFDYGKARYFTYIGNRSAHGNPQGFAGRWSGDWLFNGTKCDLKRSGGRITVYSNGAVIKDSYLQDIDDYQILDDERQYDNFYKSIITKNRSLEKSTLETWLLMEACNISSRKNKKINISDLKKNIGFKL